MNRIQKILMPNFSFGASEAKYQRGKQAIYADGRTLIQPCGTLSFDTYYNGLSTVVWKEQCHLQNLVFQAAGYGETVARLLVVTDQDVTFELDRKVIALQENEQAIFELDLSQVSQRGVIYVEFIAMNEMVIFTGGGWYTPDSVRREVVLGISITHFNRKQFVLPSIARVKKEILDDPEYQNKILFTVVDNSQNITDEEAKGVTVIPNANTGGSGGFMRGLLHYQNDTQATHVLFMDDDASCETESIKRAYWILSYAEKENSAVAGSLFLDDHPDILIEKGAFFDNICRPAFNGWNMSDRAQMVRAETMDWNINYGAWWFFAFPIASVKHYAFPFFVRGDDIMFGMLNEFNLITSIGITCYGENFATKATALNRYLDVRNHLLNTIYFQKNQRKTLRLYKLFYLDSLYSHQYGSVDCIRLALDHVLGDIQFWSENYDLSKIRPQIKQLSVAEQQDTLNIEQSEMVRKFRTHEPAWHKWARKLTFNGMLLPLYNRMIHQSIDFNANFASIFRFGRIMYVNPNTKKGYVVQVSRKEFFKRRWALISDLRRLRREFRAQQKKYRANMDQLTSKEFWEKVLLK